MGVEGENPSEQELKEIRTIVTNKADEVGLDEIDTACLQRIKSDDAYVSKFFKHTFDHPGPQVEAAAKMIMNTLKWRKEFGAGLITEADFPPSMLERASLFSHNRDKDGKKLLIFSVGKHFKGMEKMEDMKKFFVYFLERLNREERGDQITVMFDCKGAGLKNMDMEFVQFLIGCMKEYYPDPLNYILVFEMPWVLNAAFKIIKAWLPPAAVKKIKFLTKSNMGEYVTEENRLEEWGGSDPWQYQWEHEGVENGAKEVAFEDARDEIRKKTVTFANPSPAMVQSASQDSLGSALSQSSGGPTTNGGQLDILRLSPGQEVVFSATPAGDLAGKIQIQNISTKIVGYKIKTTSPEKYRVRPSTGSLSPGLAATVEIHVSGGQATTVPSSLVRDKFLITAVFLESSELAQQQLADALKTSKPDGQYRLRCQLAGSQAEQGAVGGGGGGGLLSQYGGQSVGAVQGEHDSTRQVASILKKVNQLANKQEELATQLKLCLHIELVLVGLVIILLVTLLFYTNTDCTRLVEGVTSSSAEVPDVEVIPEGGKAEL